MNIKEELTYENDYNIGYRYSLIVNKNVYSYLNIIINYRDKTSIITDFSSVVSNKGFGSILLEYIINRMKTHNILKIELDDMSKRYREIHNIYVKHGFTYINDYGPEMELKLK